ncbi:MAG: heavy-metal-associated domain-containing protein [Bacteroidetes bacterium]|nr:heavy-metal-associated domain-containing protein [Bacteroidota bacterium]
MTTIETIVVANLKCDGCATTIRNKIGDLKGVSAVEVQNDKDIVLVTHDAFVDRETITSKLLSLGYPEATEENGLLTQIKSYMSCMVGRMSN